MTEPNLSNKSSSVRGRVDGVLPAAPNRPVAPRETTRDLYDGVIATGLLRLRRRIDLLEGRLAAVEARSAAQGRDLDRLVQQVLVLQGAVKETIRLGEATVEKMAAHEKKWASRGW